MIINIIILTSLLFYVSSKPDLEWKDDPSVRISQLYHLEYYLSSLYYWSSTGFMLRAHGQGSSSRCKNRFSYPKWVINYWRLSLWFISKEYVHSCQVIVSSMSVIESLKKPQMIDLNSSSIRNKEDEIIDETQEPMKDIIWELTTDWNTWKISIEDRIAGSNLSWDTSLTCGTSM